MNSYNSNVPHNNDREQKESKNYGKEKRMMQTERTEGKFNVIITTPDETTESEKQNLYAKLTVFCAEHFDWERRKKWGGPEKTA